MKTKSFAMAALAVLGATTLFAGTAQAVSPVIRIGDLSTPQGMVEFDRDVRRLSHERCADLQGTERVTCRAQITNHATSQLPQAEREAYLRWKNRQNS